MGSFLSSSNRTLALCRKELSNVSKSLGGEGEQGNTH
jgi:hypothetical protein